jgi:hypothetical protein
MVGQPDADKLGRRAAANSRTDWLCREIDKKIIGRSISTFSRILIRTSSDTMAVRVPTCRLSRSLPAI